MKKIALLTLCCALALLCLTPAAPAHGGFRGGYGGFRGFGYGGFGSYSYGYGYAAPVVITPYAIAPVYAAPVLAAPAYAAPAYTAPLVAPAVALPATLPVLSESVVSYVQALPYASQVAFLNAYYPGYATRLHSRYFGVRAGVGVRGAGGVALPARRPAAGVRAPARLTPAKAAPARGGRGGRRR